MDAHEATECCNPFGVADFFYHVTQGRLSRNRANPGLSDTIPSGLAESGACRTLTADNLFFVECKRAMGKKWARRPCGAMLRAPSEGGARMALLQVFGFSPVMPILRVFGPFLSCKGVDFSPVTRLSRFFFSPDSDRQIEYRRGIGRRPWQEDAPGRNHEHKLDAHKKS
jgi:hypothetical protein